MPISLGQNDSSGGLARILLPCRELLTAPWPTLRADYFACINATVVSSIRLENPHSLSYQLDTLTRRPETLVSVASKIDERASWLKSLDTSGSVL